MKLNNELNNMSWRVRPDEVLLEVGRLFGSKIGLQKLNFEVSGMSKRNHTHIAFLYHVVYHFAVVNLLYVSDADVLCGIFAEFFATTVRRKFRPGVDRQLHIAATHPSFHHHRHL